MTTVLRRSRFWLLVNIIGLPLYLYFASWIWAPHFEEGLLGGPGDPMIWGSTAFPVLAVCALADLLWLVLILVRRHWSPKWPALVLWVLVVACWYAGLAYDRSRSFTGADVYPEASSSPHP